MVVVRSLVSQPLSGRSDSGARRHRCDEPRGRVGRGRVGRRRARGRGGCRRRHRFSSSSRFRPQSISCPTARRHVLRPVPTASLDRQLAGPPRSLDGSCRPPRPRPAATEARWGPELPPATARQGPSGPQRGEAVEVWGRRSGHSRVSLSSGEVRDAIQGWDHIFRARRTPLSEGYRLRSEGKGVEMLTRGKPAEPPLPGRRGCPPAGGRGGIGQLAASVFVS